MLSPALLSSLAELVGLRTTFKVVISIPALTVVLSLQRVALILTCLQVGEMVTSQTDFSIELDISIMRCRSTTLKLAVVVSSSP
jgi:hypothetical protein